jgi:hypothetical protein
MKSTVIDVHGAYAESSRPNPVLDVRGGRSRRRAAEEDATHIARHARPVRRSLTQGVGSCHG